jgi:hypothetical protein
MLPVPELPGIREFIENENNLLISMIPNLINCSSACLICPILSLEWKVTCILPIVHLCIIGQESENLDK